MAITNPILNHFTPEETFKWPLNTALSLTDYNMSNDIDEKNAPKWLYTLSKIENDNTIKFGDKIA